MSLGCYRCPLGIETSIIVKHCKYTKYFYNVKRKSEKKLFFLDNS